MHDDKVLLASICIYIGGSRGVPPTHAPPTGSISFIFTYVFTKKCTYRRSVPSPMGQHPPMGNPGSATDIHSDLTSFIAVGMKINSDILSVGI